MADDLLTVGEAARRLGVSSQAVHNLVSNGKLASQRTVGRMLILRSGEVERLRKQRAAAAKAALKAKR